MINRYMKAVLTALCLFGFLGAGSAVYASGPGYRVIKKMHLGGEGGWDYSLVDSAARRLYISRSTHVMVVDIDRGEIIGDIPDTPGVHGIALAPQLGRGFTSNGQAGTSTIFDLKSLKVLGSVKTGTNPDAILYDPASKRVFTFNGSSHDATAFDAATGKVTGHIELDGKPEFAVTDGKGRIYVNIEDKNEVAEIDSGRLVVLNYYSIAPCKSPTGMAIDIKHHRTFSGCRNRVMAVLDTKRGKVISTVPIGAGVDGNGFDPEKGLVFSSNGEGSLTVARESAPGNYEVVETVRTQPGARTMALDTTTHDIYLPDATFSSPLFFTGKRPKTRPKIVKDSFVVIVVGK